MHANRLLYTLPEYQEKLRDGYKSLGLMCQNKENHRVFIFRPVPKTPWLPEGRKKFYYRLQNRVKNINYNKRYSFCTLTYSNSLFSAVDASRRIKHDIDLFFKRLNYRKSKPQYFYVIELTDKFMPHIHLIFDRYVHKKKIFKSWYKVTGCTAIKIKSLPFKQAISYCMKYLNKSKKQSEAKFGFLFSHIDRIWTCSRNFFKKLPDEEKKWLFQCFFKDYWNWSRNILGWSPESDPDRDLTSEELELLLFRLLDSDRLLRCSDEVDDIYYLEPFKNWRKNVTFRPI